MKREHWQEELDYLEQRLALHLAMVRQGEGDELLIALRRLLETLADLRALLYSRIAELGVAEDFWSSAEDA